MSHHTATTDDPQGGHAIGPDRQRHDPKITSTLKAARVAASAQTKPIRLVVADDSAVYRRGLWSLTDEDPGLALVAEASSAVQAVEQVAKYQPDVAVLEIRMGGQSGIDACVEIRRRSPSTRVLFLTGSDDLSDLVNAIKACAHGYLLKSLPLAQITHAIRLAHSGEVVVPPPMSRHLVAAFSWLHRDSAYEGALAMDRGLTSSELDVLNLLAHGKSNSEIAQALNRSESTVNNNVRHVLRKFQTRSRTHAATQAVRENLINLHPSDGVATSPHASSADAYAASVTTNSRVYPNHDLITRPAPA